MGITVKKYVAIVCVHKRVIADHALYIYGLWLGSIIREFLTYYFQTCWFPGPRHGDIRFG